MSTEPISPAPARMNPWWRVLFTLLFFGSAGYCAYDGDYVLAVVCVVTGGSAFSGYRIGLVYAVTWLVAIGTAVAYAPSIGLAQETRFTQWLGTTGLLNRFISIGAVGVLISFVISTFAIMMANRALKKRPRLDAMNRWLGFTVGGVEGLAMCACFLGGMLVLEPIERERAPRRDPADSRGKLISRTILEVAETTHASRLGDALETYNPFTRIPQLNKVEEVQQTAQVLSDPAKIKGLLKHPSIRALQQRAEVKTAVAKLNADPRVQDILQSGQPMNREMAMSLLSHPAVLELIDQPGFLEQASKVMRDVTQNPR